VTEESLKQAGAQLRRIREARNKSQEDVAFASTVDQSTYSKIERLGPQVVSWPKFLRILDALDLDIEVSFKSRKPSGG
jgi:transcriptional regulator with XRE-family HTH domain